MSIKNAVDNDDFGFYGSSADENNVEDIHGITDVVTSYTFTKLDYPCLVFKKDFRCEKHKMRIIGNMVKSESIEKDISLYFQNGDDIYKIGKISGRQVDSLISIVGEDSLDGFYDDGTPLTRDRLYVLCTF